MRQLHRLKKTKRPFTADLFYIYECDNGMYHFRDSHTHMVISTATNLSGLRRCIDIVFNRYKNYDSYLKAVASLSEQTVSEKDRVRREKEYKRVKDTFTYIIEEQLKEFYFEREQFKDIKKTRCLVPTVTVESSTKPSTPETPVSSPVLLHRKRRKSRL